MGQILAFSIEKKKEPATFLVEFTLWLLLCKQEFWSVFL